MVLLRLAMPLKQGLIAFLRVCRLQCRHMPRAADDGDRSVEFLARRGDFEPHMRFALGLELRDRAFTLPQRHHRVGDGREYRAWFRILLDDVRPPAFAILIAGGAGQRADRIAPMRSHIITLAWFLRFVSIDFFRAVDRRFRATAPTTAGR